MAQTHCTQARYWATILILGLILNLLVTWLISISSNQYEETDRRSRPATSTDLPSYLKSFWPAAYQEVEVQGHGLGVSESDTLCSDADPQRFVERTYGPEDGPLRLTLARMKYGWPIRSMYLDTFYVFGNTRDKALLLYYPRCFQEAGLRAGFHLRLSQSQVLILPLAIEPVGFIANSLICTAFLFMLYSGQKSVRRWYRNIRDYCPYCNYDLAGIESIVCPECGANIKN